MKKRLIMSKPGSRVLRGNGLTATLWIEPELHVVRPRCYDATGSTE